MNALLIYPEFPETFWSFTYALKFIRKRASLPPLGLLTLASILPPGWAKRLVDMNVRALTAKDLEWADYAFLGGMALQRESARRVITACREAGVKVVAGGPLFTSEPDQFDDVDHLVLNEAELTVPLFLADLESGTPQRVYATTEFADLRTTPPPLWELADRGRYAEMCVQYSRGCPFNCEFCNVTTLFGHRPRTKGPDQIIGELDSLARLGWRGSVFFVDDNLIGNKVCLKTELLPALIAWQKHKPGMTFHTEASINLADDGELMAMMVEAGFNMVFIGIETPDEVSLGECSKHQNKSRNMIEDVKRMQKAGLQVQGGFIVGFDSDTPTIFQRQIDFIQQSGIVTAMVGLLQAPSGTRLHDRLRKEGRLLAPMSGDNTDGTTNIVPVMSLDVLREGYVRIVRSIYAPGSYYQRVRTFLREYTKPKVKAPIELQYKLALFRSILRLGIIGKERAEYWKLLLWTSFRHPRLLPTAVTLSIYGHHFRKIYEHLSPKNSAVPTR
ncbi:DUF4070 domain-containing protein [Candidatus Fermentibacteria bacterium]|nr:DUF4070 domain-containing protein [Candidatus Fermentibacteria bacterium]